MADGSLRPLQIKVVTPHENGDIPARMARNDARNLAEAVQHKSCVIVGSGPSARHEALWRFLKANPETTTVACNGALSLFAEHDLSPTYWSCCDPQAGEVMNFLPANPDRSVTYLLATKCPESLFEHLLANGCNVHAWRLDDMTITPNKLHIPCAVSITLVTQNLMRFMGFTRFEMYGWDCCYLDGKHHASNQPEPEQPLDFSIESEERLIAELTENGPIYDFEEAKELHSFKITGSWAAELHDACIQAHNYKAMGYELVVHGPGAVGALLRARGLIA